MRNRVEQILKCFKSFNILNSHVKLSKSIKKDVLRMYDYTCAGNIPGYPCTYNIREALEIDHIVPRSILCIHKKYNLQVLCSNCHSLKTTYYDIDLIRKFKEGSLKRKDIKKHVNTFI
jgi:5-methylcytosine-specific restriction endonuclease McrA